MAEPTRLRNVLGAHGNSRVAMRRQAAAIAVGEGKRSTVLPLRSRRPRHRRLQGQARRSAKPPVVTECAADQAAPHRKTTAIKGSGVGIFGVPQASPSPDAYVETMGAGAAAAGRQSSAMSAACAVLRGAAKSPAKTARWLRTTRRMLLPCYPLKPRPQQHHYSRNPAVRLLQRRHYQQQSRSS